MRIAAKDAVFGLPDAAIGLSPTSGMTHILPRLVGLGVAMDLTLSTEPIGAEEAHRIGLVTRIVDPDELLEQAGAVAMKLASFPRTGMARTKSQFYAALE
jgi:2-(1,2-epoxy-1,2-dihydrophenyl)acetyl-CoA isomerase